MENTFKVSYITTLPKEGNAPSITISGNNLETYFVRGYEISDNLTENLLFENYCSNNQTLIPRLKQWFTNWKIYIYNSNNVLVYTDIFNPNFKTIFIKVDAYALGDTIAWIPYIEEFRLKYCCNVICSTFHNEILIDNYPNILFVKPNTVINNVYAQYYIGATNDSNLYYSPLKVNYHPLQDVASSILDLDRKELKPNLSEIVKHSKPSINSKYVTLSEFGSSSDKEWKETNGWQQVVNYLNINGYKVVVVSKEKTNLVNVIDKSGNLPLIDRMVDIKHANFHLGVSSGLSWVSWGLNTHTVMISDVTPNFHEFQTKITRLNKNNLKCVDYSINNHTSIEEVLIKLRDLIEL